MEGWLMTVGVEDCRFSSSALSPKALRLMLQFVPRQGRGGSGRRRSGGGQRRGSVEDRLGARTPSHPPLPTASRFLDFNLEIGPPWGQSDAHIVVAIKAVLHEECEAYSHSQ